eukprot:154617-Amphidinium_carterae.1
MDLGMSPHNKYRNGRCHMPSERGSCTPLYDRIDYFRCGGVAFAMPYWLMHVMPPRTNACSFTTSIFPR